MRYTKKELYKLLLVIYRHRDIEISKSLEALLNIIAEQVEVLEKDIERLYNNLFIEICDPWVIPYISDLVVAVILHPRSEGMINHRARVANTISYRRRKGTLSILEQLARDVTGWNTRRVEFFNIMNTTQYLNYLRHANFRSAHVRALMLVRARRACVFTLSGPRTRSWSRLKWLFSRAKTRSTLCRFRSSRRYKPEP